MGKIDAISAAAPRARKRASSLRRALCGLIAAALLAPAASAEMQVRTIAVGGVARDYLLYAPEMRSVAADGGMPLVVALHGGNAVADMMSLYSRFNEIAAREQFAVAYPYGVGRWWNDGRHYDGRGESGADDVAFMRALVADVGAHVKIDRARVFATGISNGGFMSFRLACEAADLFAAIAPVAATMPAELGARCRPAKPVPVLLIHGTSDALVPYVGGHARTGNTLRGAIWSADRSIAFWAARNGCPGAPAMRVLPDLDPADGSRVIESEYRGCAGAPAALLRVEGGGHTWPGGVQILPTAMLGTTNRDIDASEAIWRFFKAAPAR